MSDSIENPFLGPPKSEAVLQPPYWALGGPDSRNFRTPACVLALLSDAENFLTRVANLREVVAIILQARIQPAPTPGEVEQIRAGVMGASDLIFCMAPPQMHSRMRHWFDYVAFLADPAATGPFEEWVRLGWDNFTEDKPRYWAICGRAIYALIEMLEAISDGLTFLEASGVDISPFAKKYGSHPRPQADGQAGNC